MPALISPHTAKNKSPFPRQLIPSAVIKYSCWYFDPAIKQLQWQFRQISRGAYRVLPQPSSFPFVRHSGGALLSPLHSPDIRHSHYVPFSKWISRGAATVRTQTRLSIDSLNNVVLEAVDSLVRNDPVPPEKAAAKSSLSLRKLCISLVNLHK